MLKTKSRKIQKTPQGRTCLVSFLISEFDVGPLAADLAGKVGDFKMDWIENIPYHRNKPGQPRAGKSGGSKILKWVNKAGKEGLGADEGRKLYAKAGFKETAFYAAVNRLVKMGQLKRVNGRVFLAKGKA